MSTTQSNWLIERSFLTFSCCLKVGDTKRMGRVGATHHDELPGYAASEQRGDAQRDDAGTAHKTADPGHLEGAAGTNSRREDGE